MIMPEFIKGTIINVIKGDTMSLDYSSYSSLLEGPSPGGHDECVGLT